MLVLPVLVPLIPWHGPRRAYRALILGFLPLVVWELFSMVYYGFPIPNTAFAKMKTGVAEGDLFRQGVTYVLDSVARDPLTLLVAVAVASGPRSTIRTERGRSASPSWCNIGTVTYVGGDFMSGRMFAPPLVAAVVVFIHADVATLFAYAWMPVVLAAAIGGAAVRAIARGCAWRATSSESWIRLVDVAGAGTATVNFVVDANRTTAGRTGAVTIAWPDGTAAFAVKQDGLTNCRFALIPPAQTAASASMDFSLTVSPSDPSCSWKALADVPWIAITSGNRGTVVYHVQTNDTHARRDGSITVTGLISGSGAVAVTQLP